MEGRREGQKLLLIIRLAYLEVVISDDGQIKQKIHDDHFFAMLTSYVHA